MLIQVVELSSAIIVEQPNQMYTSINGVAVIAEMPAGSTSLMSQYLMHHDKRFFREPGRFNPLHPKYGMRMRLIRRNV